LRMSTRAQDAVGKLDKRWQESLAQYKKSQEYWAKKTETRKVGGKRWLTAWYGWRRYGILLQEDLSIC
jgi:hypothetical protein